MCGCESGKCCPYTGKGIKFGLAFGLSNAILMLLIGWIAWLTGWGSAFIDNTANLYQGYAPSFVGGLIGALWGLVIGFIYGFVFGVVLKCCSRCCGKCGSGSSSCSMPNDYRK